MDSHYKEPIWGYAFELSDTKTYAYLNLKPTKGILSPTNVPPPEDDAPLHPEHRLPRRPAKYFVPYKKNGTLNWSKSRNIYNTRFAKTETEATHEYNKLVNTAIEFLYQTARDLSENFITPVDDTIDVNHAILAHIQDLRKDDTDD